MNALLAEELEAKRLETTIQRTEICASHSITKHEKLIRSDAEDNQRLTFQLI